MSSLPEIIVLAITLYFTSAYIWNTIMCIKHSKNAPDKGIFVEIMTCILWAVYITIF